MTRQEISTRARQTAPSHQRALRFGPNLYIAQTQPGFEGIAAAEIAARVHGAREYGRRIVPDRAGMTIFGAPHAAALANLRCSEDIFALAGYRSGPDPSRVTADRIRAAAREAPFVEAAVSARPLFQPGARAGRRLRFKVVARQAGEHPFRRVDLKRAVERGIEERRDHTWRLDESDPDVEFWATMLPSEMTLAVRLSGDAMRHRDYQLAHRAASLRPAVAAALGWLSRPDPRDIVLDPFCGAGTILIERAHFGRYARLIGGDANVDALAAAALNIGPRYKPITLQEWDAAALPIADASVTRVITNLPWGVRYGSRASNRRLYPEWIAEMGRVLIMGGTMVLLTSEWRLVHAIAARAKLRILDAIPAVVLGARATAFVCVKTG